MTNLFNYNQENNQNLDVPYNDSVKARTKYKHLTIYSHADNNALGRSINGRREIDREGTLMLFATRQQKATEQITQTRLVPTGILTSSIVMDL